MELMSILCLTQAAFELKAAADGLHRPSLAAFTSFADEGTSYANIAVAEQADSVSTDRRKNVQLVTRISSGSRDFRYKMRMMGREAMRRFPSYE